jgi:predicted N-acetyltransferase YhbS
MMMVHPSHRSRGVAGRLMKRALEHVAGATVFLTSTALGRPLYARLGFVETGGAQRLEGKTAAHPEEAPPGLRAMRDEDLPGVLALDELAFGGSRRSLVHALVATADRACVVERAGAIVGFGFSSILEGSRLVGPVVAREDADARAIAARMCASSEVPVKLDLPADETVLRTWARAAGLEPTGVTTVMVLGGPALPGRREWVRAMAGRAYG